MIDSLITLDTNLNVTTTEHGKTGALTTRIERPAEFKLRHKKLFPNASNREVKRAYERYVVDQSTLFVRGLDCGKLAAAIENKQIGLEMLKVNKDGNKLNLQLIDLTQDAEEKELKSLAERLESLTVAELQAVLAKKMAKTEKITESVTADSADFRNSPE